MWLSGIHDDNRVRGEIEVTGLDFGGIGGLRGFNVGGLVAVGSCDTPSITNVHVTSR